MIAVWAMALLALAGAAAGDPIREATLTHEVPVDFADIEVVAHERSDVEDQTLRPCGDQHIRGTPDGAGWRFVEASDEHGCAEARIRLSPPAGARSVVVQFDAVKHVIQTARPGVAETAVDVVTQLHYTQGTQTLPVDVRVFFDRTEPDEATNQPLRFDRVLDGSFDGIGWYFEDAGQRLSVLAAPLSGQTTMVDIVRPVLRYPGIPVAHSSEVASEQIRDQHLLQQIRSTIQVPDGFHGEFTVTADRGMDIVEVITPSGVYLREDAYRVETFDQARQIIVPADIVARFGPGAYAITWQGTAPLEARPFMVAPAIVVLVAPAVVGVYATSGAFRIQRRTPAVGRNAVASLRWSLAACWLLYIGLLLAVATGDLWTLLMTWPIPSQATLLHVLFAASLLAFVSVGILGRRSLVDHMERSLREQANLNQALARTNRALARSNDDLQRFAHVASHDLRDPLNTANGYAQLLRDRYGDRLDADGRAYLAACLESTARMARLIDDLLEIGRVDAPSPPVRVGLRTAFDEATQALATRIKARKAVVTHGRLPTVYGYPTQLSQLLQNLIGNAIKFCPPGRRPKIHVAARRAGDTIVLRVRDNGIGIPKQDRDRVFGMFHRGHPSTFEGTGIGLAVCRRIMERHGGEIAIEDAPGHGTIIRCTFPADPVAALPSPTTAPARQARGSPA